MPEYPSPSIAPRSATWPPPSVAKHQTPGERLRALREETGLSREIVCESVGVRGQTLYRYEKDEIEEMGGDALLALARFYNTSADWIVFGDPPNAPPGFREFVDVLAPTLDPPLKLSERGRLAYQFLRHHHPSGARYLAHLQEERAGESEADAAASGAAMDTARSKGAARGVPTRKRRK